MTQDRQHLPATRKSVTHTFVIHAKPIDVLCPKCRKNHPLDEVGDVDVCITVGLFDNGQPGEIFIKLNHYGDTIKGFADQWAIVVSLALQHGVPLASICAKGEHSRFEPSGYTDTFIYDKSGKVKGRINASSVIDYVCRWLQEEFLKEG